MLASENTVALTILAMTCCELCVSACLPASYNTGSHYSLIKVSIHCCATQVRRRFGLVTTSSSTTSTTSAAVTGTPSALCLHIAGGGTAGGQLALIGDTSLAQITREASTYTSNALLRLLLFNVMLFNVAYL
jgi:hypothetical protein